MNLVRHGSSTTWFQTPRYCRAKVQFNSINLVRHTSGTTLKTGLRICQYNAWFLPQEEKT